jgi:hypothetical protein
MKLKNPENNFKILGELLSEGETYGQIVDMYTGMKNFTTDHFVSLLFYLGILTIRGRIGGSMILEPPNYVIMTIYWQIFYEILEERSNYEISMHRIHGALIEMYSRGKLEKLISLVEEFLDKAISNRDYIKLDEKHVKLVFILLVNLGNAYHIKSEYELSRNYVDVMFLERPGAEVDYEYGLEIKYVKSSAGEDEVERAKSEGLEQLRRYMESDEAKSRKKLRGYVIVFHGCKAVFVSEG